VQRNAGASYGTNVGTVSNTAADRVENVGKTEADRLVAGGMNRSNAVTNAGSVNAGT